MTELIIHLIELEVIARAISVWQISQAELGGSNLIRHER